MTTRDVVEIGTTFALPIVLLVLGYIFGRKQKIDEVRIKEGYKLTERIVVLFQEIDDAQEFLHSFYRSNFEYAESVDEAIDRFESVGSVFHGERAKIQMLAEKRGELNEKIQVATVYLNKKKAKKLLLDFRAYLDLGNFSYQHDGIGFFSSYYCEFFRTLMDPTISAQRAKLSRSILSQLGSLRP